MPIPTSQNIAQHPKAAGNEDFWLRHIIERGATSGSPPTLKPKYLENKLKPVSNKPWEAENSGRVLSKAFDIAECAEAAAAEANAKAVSPSLRFSAVAYINVRDVKCFDRNLDVFEEPMPKDQAHANLVVYKLPIAHALPLATDQKISHEFVKNLAPKFQVCAATDISSLIGLRSAAL